MAFTFAKHTFDGQSRFMRNRLFYRRTLLLCCLLITIAAHSQLPKIYLHPKTVAREKQSKFLDSIRFIPLQIAEGMELSANYFVEVADNHFLLTDYQNKILFLYLRNGDFVKKIDYKKLGGNFYPAYQQRSNEVMFFGTNKNYTLTQKDQVKIRLDWENPRNRKYFKKYSLDLNDPLLTIKKDEPTERDILQLYDFYEDFSMQGKITISPLFKDSIDHEIKIYKVNNVVKTYFPFNRINEPRFLHTQESVAFARTDTPYINIVTRPFCDTIYKMVRDSLFPTHKLVLPLENSLPQAFYTKQFKNATDRDNYRRNNGWMMQQIHSFYETPRFVFLSVRYFSNFDSYIIDKNSNTTYKTKNITSDSSQYNLQLLPSYGLMRKENAFYKTQKASDLVTFFENNKDIPIPKELDIFLKSKPPATSLVIVEFKFKK